MKFKYVFWLIAAIVALAIVGISSFVVIKKNSDI